MDKQTLNRLNYLRKNSDYLNERERGELHDLERAYRTDQALAEDNARAEELFLHERNRAKEALQKRSQLVEQPRVLQAVPEEVQPQIEAQNPLETLEPFEEYTPKRPTPVNNRARQREKKAKKIDKPKKKGRWLKRLALILGVLLLLFAGALTYFALVTEKGLAKTYVETGNGMLDASQPLTVALLGVDTGDATRGGAGSWNGNSDSQIVMTINPKTHTTTMISMERDTMSNIMDENGKVIFQAKMNAAYPYAYANAGGIKAATLSAMHTLGEQTGIPINNFMVVNMDGLVNLVNYVGGIDVVNDSGSTITIANTEPQYTATVPYIGAGKSQHINGEQALVFSRDRDTLPNGDYGRAAHQREVIAATFKKLLSMHTVLNYKQMLDATSSDFKTNIKATIPNMFSTLAYRSAFDKMVSIQYEGVGATAAGSDGVYASYQLMPRDVDLAVQNIMRQSIGLSALTSLSSNVITYQSYMESQGYSSSGYTLPSYFMPSATVTEKGKTPQVYGVDTSGNLVTLNSSNASYYVSTKGGAVGK
ncbi:MAG: LCP family protein [Streptococcaceae bacterium]|jgi:LCP family protein required for cell wall assembly|nr:LCP family protein [Streptococcaceae bacterium]